MTNTPKKTPIQKAEPGSRLGTYGIKKDKFQCMVMLSREENEFLLQEAKRSCRSNSGQMRYLLLCKMREENKER